MKTHAQKQRQPQQFTSLQCSQRTWHAMGNQAVTASPPAHAEAPQARLDSFAPTRFAHDFSRIPIHSQAPTGIQAKLAVGTPGDIYEQEADRVATHVMGRTQPRPQRDCACGGGCPGCHSEHPADEYVQTKSDVPGKVGEVVAPPIVNEALQASGRPLDPPTRTFMESRFGHDFSRVRVHTEAQAAASALAMHALAYTVGNDVVFGAGRYAPGTDTGKHLLAHELTHTIQQGGGASKAVDSSPLGHVGSDHHATAVSLHSGPQVAGFWPFDNDEETLAFKSVAAEVSYRLQKNKTADDQKAYQALNGQSVTAMLATLEQLKAQGLLATLIGRFEHATGVNRPRLWIAFSAVQYKGWGGAEESLKTEIAQMRANNEGDQVDEMLAYRNQPAAATPVVATPPAAPTGAKQEAQKARVTKGTTDVVEKIKKDYGEYIADASKQYGLTEAMLTAIIATESKGDPDASSGAAYGLMQVTKGTWEGTRKLDANLQEYDFDSYWKDPHVNILFGASVLKSNMKAMGVKTDDPNAAKLAVVGYNAGLGTVKAAIALATEAGSSNPEADCLKPEYMKPAIKSTGIHSYYLTGSGHRSNPKVKDVTPDPDNAKKRIAVPAEGSTLEEAEEAAVDLKYKEVSQYPDKVSDYMAAQTADAPAGDKAAGGAATAEPEKFTPVTYPLSDKPVEIVKESDAAKTLRVAESPAVYVRNVLQSVNINYDDFYKNFTTIRFFGHQVSPAIHQDFAAVLKKIERDYAKNKTPQEAGEALGVKSVGGSRDYPTSAAFSMHLVGMAVDINYTDSPFIGASASDVFGRAGLLIDGTAYSYDEKSHTYEQFGPLQKAILAYFALLDNTPMLDEKLKAPVKTAWPISKANEKLALAKSWEGMSAALAQQQIQADLSFIAKRWERTEEQIKKHGFLGVSKELVETMTKGNATNWGGGSYGDIMHFDMRTQGKGATINKAFGTYAEAKKKEGRKKYEAEDAEARKARRAAEEAATAEKAQAKKTKKAKK